MDTKELKIKLYNSCESILSEKIERIRIRLASIRESKSKETKSSAGDKFETGRAMMQIEEDKCHAQLANIIKSMSELKKVSLESASETVRLGSLVITNQENYFISIGIGKILIGDKVYYCISPEAPIGQLLFGEKNRKVIVFNEKEIVIESVL